MFAFRLCLSAAFAAVCMTASQGNADFYLDFGDSDSTLLPNTYAAAAPSGGTWNHNTALTITALFDTSGAATSTTVAIGAGSISGQGSWGNSTNELVLMNDNFFTNRGANWTVTISNLSDGIYDVYFYAPTNELVTTGTFTANGVAAASLPGSISTLVQGTSWDVVNGVNVSGGTMSLVSADSSTFLGLSGLQIVLVPEPASAAVLGLTFVGFALRRRR